MKVVVVDKEKGWVKEFKMPHQKGVGLHAIDDLKQEAEWVERDSPARITS
jgi:hypothetical protein